MEHGSVMKKRISSEYQECLAFFKWAQYDPILREYLIKIVTEGQRSPQSAYFLKMIGLRPGLPDYYLPIKNDKYNGLWIEMKRVDQRKVQKRDTQDDWIARLLKIGHYATYAYGSTDAIRITQEYLNDRI